MPTKPQTPDTPDSTPGEREAFEADSRQFAEKAKTLREVFNKTFCSPTNDVSVAGDAQTGYLLRLGFTALNDGLPGQTTVTVQTARKATYRYPAPN